MDKKLKKQISNFLEKSNFFSATQTNIDNRPRFRFSEYKQKSRDLPEGIKKLSPYRPHSNTSSFHSSKESSLNNTLALSRVKSSSDSKKRIVLREYRANLRKFNFSQETQGVQSFLKALYFSKIKDLQIQSNKNTEKAFMIRMQLGLASKKLNCGSLGIGKNSLSVIKRYLYVQGRLNNLILDNNYLNQQCFIIISKIVKQSTLVKLSLVSTNMNSDSCKLILDSLLTNVHLVDLNFSSHEGLYRNKLGAEGLKPFRKLFKKVPTLHMINLDGSSISEDGFRSVCEGLQNNSSLFGLQIARNLISQKLFKEEAPKLTNSKIGVLDLTGNNIKDKGMILLGEMLGRSYAYNSISVRLKHLNLTENNITFQGIQQFSKHMMLNSTIEELILDDNKLSKVGHTFQYFKSFIGQNTSLTLLSMKKIGVDGLDFSLLFEGIQKNSSLLHLDLSDNILDETATKALGFVFKHNESLKSVVLRACSIMDKTFPFLFEGIQNNSYLQKLYLDKNFLKDQSALLIQKFLVMRRNITFVSVEKNLMSIQQSRQIAQILSDNVFISSGKLQMAAFEKKEQKNMSRIDRLKFEIFELNKKMEQCHVRVAQDELFSVLCEIDSIQSQIIKEKKRVEQLKKVQYFVTQKYQ